MAMRKRVKKVVKKVKAKRGRPAKKRAVKKTTRRKKKVAKKKPAKKRKVRKVVKKTKSAKSKGTAGAAPAALRRVKTRKSIVSSKTPIKATLGNQKIKEFLKNKKVPFEVLQHSPAFTAQQIAASAHISGKNLAKTVVVSIDGKLAIVIEPGHLKVNLDAMRLQLNAQRVELATEADFQDHFPGCELGAMPPLGSLYNMDVYVSDNVSRDDFISFNAGTHSELIKMTYKDFYDLVHPKVIYA